MNLATLIILALVAIAIILAVRQVRKGGTCSCRDCNCGCANCAKRR